MNRSIRSVALVGPLAILAVGCSSTPAAEEDYASIDAMLSAVSEAGIACNEKDTSADNVTGADDGVRVASCKSDSGDSYSLIWGTSPTTLADRYAKNCTEENIRISDEGMDLGEMGTIYFSYVFGGRWQAWVTSSDTANTVFADELQSALGGTRALWRDWCTQ